MASNERYPEHWGECAHGAHCLLCCEREALEHRADDRAVQFSRAERAEARLAIADARIADLEEQIAVCHAEHEGRTHPLMEKEEC